MPRTLDERIVIVDIDEKSLAEVGRWPWGRNRLAELVDELFDRQKIAILGFDVVFAEADDSSGLKRLRQLARAS
jgi:adenylate cyclase